MVITQKPHFWLLFNIHSSMKWNFWELGTLPFASVWTPPPPVEMLAGFLDV